MDKLHSTIKSLQCVDILQVNVEEDTEVVHSGHSSGYVKIKEIEETDASKNAEDPIQDVNNRSESYEEDREPPGHTDASSERKRKSYVDSDASTLPKMRKKGKTVKDTSTQQSKTGFDERCNQLLRFKEEFGHCNVPQKNADNLSLGEWCNKMRSAYKKIQMGMKASHNLSQGRIERLEEIGFQWQGVDYDEVFEKHCRELIAFKEEFGHCNVPQRYADNPSLGQWCSHMRSAYKKVQKRMKASRNLSQDRIERLEEIGFQWQGVDYDEVFEKRCRELIAFKEEFGHCNIPRRYADNPPLGQWCSHMRIAYKKVQKGMKARYNLSQDRIERLEEIGFQWQGVYYDEVFEKRCRELIAFKEEFGHCKVPRSYADNPSLGQWCSHMRIAYKKVQKGMKASRNLSQGRIERLDEIGFQWQGVYHYDEVFEKRCRELIAFKEEFGHCKVPRSYADNPSLGQWCSHMRIAYKKVQKGMKTNSNLSQDRIERLEEIGLQWN